MTVEWRMGEAGIGSLLVTEPGVARHVLGRPHQALFFFDVAGRPTRLVTDTAGRVLGYDCDEDGDPIVDEERLIAVPTDVAAAAVRWLDAERSSARDR